MSWPRFGTKTLLVGVLLVTLGLNLLGGGCSTAGGGDPGEFGLVGFTGLTVSYTPDGVNTCTMGLGPVMIPLGLALIMLGLVRRPARNAA